MIQRGGCVYFLMIKSREKPLDPNAAKLSISALQSTGYSHPPPGDAHIKPRLK